MTETVFLSFDQAGTATRLQALSHAERATLDSGVFGMGALAAQAADGHGLEQWHKP